MMLPLKLRRSTALTLGALLLGAPLLSSCGFNMATDRPYTPGSGVNDQTKSVDVLNAAIVSKADGSGTFIASFANNNPTQPVQVTGVAMDAAGAPANSLSGAIDVPAGGLTNLAQKNQGVALSGSFKLGDFVPLQISFSTGEQVRVEVPVVLDANQYAGLDTASQGASASSSPSASPTS